MIEDLLEAGTVLGTTLYIAEGLDLLSEGLALMLAYTFRRVLSSHIRLGADEDVLSVRAVTLYLRKPLIFDVVEGYLRVNGETDEEDISERVGEWADTIIIFLTGSIEETKGDLTIVDDDFGSVVIENSRDMLGWEGVGSVTDQHTGLTNGTVT